MTSVAGSSARKPRLSPSIDAIRTLRQGATVDDEASIVAEVRERIAGHLTANAKLTLLISEDGLPEFDRFRLFDQAFAGGSIVISDRTLIDPRCRSGHNYFREELRHIPQLVDWLLHDQDGLHLASAIRRQAFETVKAINRDGSAPEGLARFLRIH